MGQRKKVCLDKKGFVNLLETMCKAVEAKKKNKSDIQDIEKSLNKLIVDSNIDKEQLVIKWVQLSGEEVFNNLKTKNIKDYFGKMSSVLKGGAIYLNKTGDPLFLIAELVVLTDMYLYGEINLQAS